MIGYVVLIIYTHGQHRGLHALPARAARASSAGSCTGCSRCCPRWAWSLILLFSLNIIGGDPLTFQPDKWALPPAPFNYAVIFVGDLVHRRASLLVWYLKATNHEDWMEAAAEGASERPATPEEIAAMEGEW